MEHTVSFGAWLQRRRKLLDLTQDALAQRVACSVATIRKIEADERRPSRQVAELLAEVLEIPTGDRPQFLRIARGELRVERLSAVPPVPPAPLPEMVKIATPLRGSLPQPPTPLVGRNTELAELHHLLARPECRLLTVVGPGGIGKTRLALAAAQAILDFRLRMVPPRLSWKEALDSNMPDNPKSGEPSGSQNPKFPDGVYFVPLAPLSSSEHIVSAIANALEFTFAGSGEPSRQLLNYLAAKQMLIVLDNLEHLLEDIGRLTELLEQTPGVKLLVTSRERLNLQGEWVFDLQGLPVPPTGRVEGLAEYSAVALFVENAQRVRSGFALSAQNGQAIVRICRLVEGMPLGIELAAAWVHLLSCQEVAQEIERSIDFLAVSRRDVPARQRSLRATFDHSWHLLSPSEQKVLRQLSVFRGGFVREAAEQVAGATLGLLAALVAKSLLHRTRESSGRGRYDLHELVRQYASEKLAQSGEIEPTRREHLAHFLGLAERAERLLSGADQIDWLNRLEAEQDNLRTALGWALEHDLEPGLRLAAAAARYWHMRGHWAEGHAWLMKGVQSSDELSPSVRAKAFITTAWLGGWLGDTIRREQLFAQSLSLYQGLGDRRGMAYAQLGLGFIKERQGHFLEAKAFLEEGLAVYRALGDKAGIAEGLIYLGFVANDLGDYHQAAASFEESVALYREMGNRWASAEPLRHLGAAMHVLGDFARAVAFLTESLTVSQEMKDWMGKAYTLFNLGIVLLAQNDHLQAAARFAESVALAREAGEVSWSAYPLCQLGVTALRQGELARAAPLFAESLPLFHAANGFWGIAECFAGMAGIAAAQDNCTRAVCLIAAGEALRQSHDLLRSPDDQIVYEHRLTAIKARLTEAAFAAAWTEGRTLTLEQAINLALATQPG